ncbi:bifunctional folylpolyglutamate synthase/dihydrofolate synthase [Ostreibacterium oceani]|uniref:Mur ligase central domain-containing protein n=1 Tax=Ostreibacterium oceani TaxID=2654998 RepID=A0A6N7F1H5_9GAMM|nr:Mur ligase family protein [Ostreibacterium oceani]MPV85706.1 hypothetical protein [Ostreibacterium oceani]
MQTPMQPPKRQSEPQQQQRQQQARKQAEQHPASYPSVSTLDEFYAALYALPPRFNRAITTPRAVTAKLLQQLGHPERQCRSVVITGSKGKGSVALMLSAALQQAHARVGLFTSPHLFDYRERIRINGEMIPVDTLVNLGNCVFAAANQLTINHEDERPRFFEITTAIAYLYFAEQSVAMAVMETGIGAKTDAVNQSVHEVAILTHIEAEHLDIFGDMPTLIDEKCGVMRAHTPLILGAQQPVVVDAVKTIANQLSVDVCSVDRIDNVIDNAAINACPSAQSQAPSYQWPVEGCLLSAHSKIKARNMAIAVAALQALDIRMTQSVATTLSTLTLPAREEVVSEAPLIVIDSAHTAQSAANLAQFVMARRDALGLTGRLVMLVSFSATKNVYAAMEAFDKVANNPLNKAVKQIPEDISEVTSKAASNSSSQVVALQPPSMIATVIVTEATTTRSLSCELIVDALQGLQAHDTKSDAAGELSDGVTKRAAIERILSEADPEAALTLALSNLQSSDCLVITGSVYLAGWASAYYQARA